jgi:hypothetical protein
MIEENKQMNREVDLWFDEVSKVLDTAHHKTKKDKALGEPSLDCIENADIVVLSVDLQNRNNKNISLFFVEPLIYWH